ncbi:MAG: YeeE/YedE thiosulfate transporter family protein [Ignavibacteria bacterium]|jgi:rhodanese-related sulfurtransferase
MGPLVPEFVSNEFNLIVAFFVGIGFGYILEQAGFSSTKKLVGLFYGYDFTVLRVFFTAGVTAMIGVVILDHFGLLNLDLIYVNPTFLWSAIVSGLIMGGGFIIGGFCPGTSVCAAAAGKFDAMVFIVGSVIGIFGFTEFYPYLKELYLAENWDAVRINEFFGLSQELFALILTTVALLAFAFVRIVENKVNGISIKGNPWNIKVTFSYAVIPIVVILFSAFTQSNDESIHDEINTAIKNNTRQYDTISADELLAKLNENNDKYNLIDLRSPEEYKEFHIPLAINIPLNEIEDYRWGNYFNQQFKENIFYSDKIEEAKKAYLISEYWGESHKKILSINIDTYKKLISASSKNISDNKKNNFSEWRYNTHNELIQKEKYLSKFSNPVKKKEIKIQGGCS